MHRDVAKGSLGRVYCSADSDFKQSELSSVIGYMSYEPWKEANWISKKIVTEHLKLDVQGIRNVWIKIEDGKDGEDGKSVGFIDLVWSIGEDIKVFGWETCRHRFLISEEYDPYFDIVLGKSALVDAGIVF